MTGDRAVGDTRRDERPGGRHAIRLAAVGALALTVVAGGMVGLHHWDTVRAEREVAEADAARLQDQRRAREQAEAARVAEARAEAERAAARSGARQARLTRARAAVVALAEDVREPAAQVLADTEGQVADDAVRAGLEAAITTLDDAVAADDLRPAVVRKAVTELRAAQDAVVEAHATWQDEAERRAAEEKAAATDGARDGAPAAGPGPGGGAGPDCGGPESYEPPTGGPSFYTSTPTVDGDGSNGRIPRSQMTALGWCVDARGNAQWLRSDAAAALTRLNEAFRAEFGENIAIDMAYRSYADQVAMREHYGSVAARPGTSNHGWGTAFDTWEWDAYSFGSARYEWLVENGPQYGWFAPSWARQNGANPEYWHFEYVG